MQQRAPIIGRIGFKFGLYVALAYIVYFLIMRAAGLADKVDFRFVNYIFLIIGLFMASRALHHNTPPLHGYLPSLFMSLSVVLFSSAIFGLFMLIYSGLIDRGFIDTVKNDIPVNQMHVSAFWLALMVMSELIPVGIALSLGVGLFYQHYNESIDKAQQQAIDQRNHAHH
jgi:vacuolar-type H+-ATPase subunit I/STV1